MHFETCPIYHGQELSWATAQSLYGNDFSAIVTNVTGQSRDGWSRESTHAKTVRNSDYTTVPRCRLLVALPLFVRSASTCSSMQEMHLAVMHQHASNTACSAHCGIPCAAEPPGGGPE